MTNSSDDAILSRQPGIKRRETKMQNDKHLETIRAELAFIGRHVNNLETSDFDAVDEIHMALASARRALEEYELGLQPECEGIPAGVALPEAA